MSKSTPRRKAAAAVGMLVTFALGMTLAVLVAGSATAASSKTTTKKSTSKTTTSKAAASTVPTPTYETTTTDSPGDGFFVLNGTVNAASDHEIVGSSAFPNFTTGAIDNYYAMAHSHVDNSPFAEGTASPADTGPVGQTAAAGNFQQPQYADARWPGDKDSGKATYGTKGQPYAEATASEYRATADASEATNGLSGPGLGGKKTLALPVGFDLRLRQALGGWKAKWQGALGLEKQVAPKKLKPARPTVTTPAGTVTVPKAPVTVPRPEIAPPAVTVTAPLGAVSTPTPQPTVGANPAPPVTVPSTTLPSAGAQGAPRSLAARPVARPAAPAPSSSASAAPADGESLLTSSTRASLVETAAKKTVTTTTDTTTTGTTTTGTTTTKTTKTTTATTKTATTKTDKPKKSYALVTSGESSLGRVSLGGGQIVIEGIHVTASITNDGTPSYKAAVTVASATIGGVPVTIDQDGVHVNGQGQAIPYQQASDALNSALKQAGIQLFLVGPEVTNNACGQPGTGSGSDSGTSSTTTTTTTGSSDQSGMPSSCGGQGGSMCDQSGSGSGSGGAPGLPGSSTTTSTDQSGTTTTPSSCGQPCDQTGTGTGTTATTTTAATTTSRTPTTPTSTSTTRTSTDQSSGSGMSSSCGGTGLPSTTSSCAQPGTTTTTGSGDQMGTTTTSGSSDMGFGMDTTSSAEMTVTATGVHLVFTQPVNQPGVPAQYVEHILGEVFVDSLASPAPTGAGADLGFGLPSAGSSFSSSSSPSCGGRSRSGRTSGGSASSAGGSAGLSAGGSAASGGLSSSGSTSQPGSSSTGTSLPAAFAGALRKPLWLLLAYLVWQSLVVGTGWSLWNWRRDEAS